MSLLVKFLLITTSVAIASAATVRPVTIPGNNYETCPAQNEREAAIHNLKAILNVI